MIPASFFRDSRDTRLWVVAGVVAIGVHLVALSLLSLAVLRNWIQQSPPALEPDSVAAAAEAPMVILPLLPKSPPATTPPPEPAREFARTSADQQAATPPERAPFIGEHDTRAAGDLPAESLADPRLASQQGREPRADEIETTQSSYQDGDLAHRMDGEVKPMVPNLKPGEAMEEAEAMEEVPPPLGEKPTKWANGPDTVAVAEREKQETEGKDRREVTETPKDPPRVAQEEIRKKPAPTEASREPGFRGNQERVRLRGAISRSGKPALDVESGPLGRYNAALSRAIEKSWQRAVVRNRDFITPGVLRIQVVLDPKGQVRSIATVDEVGVTTIQRGFTHSAIRDAELPPMPADVQQELQGEPLELLYNFIF
ncbi:hypothetical protein HNR46_003581 [Haloferula luteola]|uniref:TonB C-terminal domain-containing protein n=1 Tax=Haloferula luteola TaxID=595692 RepID=A0A840V5M7_9BACT|nr:hypothetical protein [Haloferula luteola]MBB5353325.1 hypothetical protein [Haloferula luteola]